MCGCPKQTGGSYVIRPTKYQTINLHGPMGPKGPMGPHIQMCCDSSDPYRDNSLDWKAKDFCFPNMLAGVVYIQTAVFYSSLHIHHQIVHTSHFPIFSRPQPGGGVYLWGPNPFFRAGAVVQSPICQNSRVRLSNLTFSKLLLHAHNS